MFITYYTTFKYTLKEEKKENLTTQCFTTYFVKQSAIYKLHITVANPIHCFLSLEEKSFISQILASVTLGVLLGETNTSFFCFH